MKNTPLKLKLTHNQKQIIIAISSSIVNALVLVFSILSLSFLMLEEEKPLSFYLFLSFLFLTVSMINLVIYNGKSFKNNPISFYKHIVFAALYLSFGFTVLFKPFDKLAILIVSGLFLLSISANRVCRAIENKKTFPIIFNSILALISLGVAIMIFTEARSETIGFIPPLFMIVIIMVVSLVNILVFAFSRIKLGALTKIIRKTYAAEVLYGLLILIVTFSFVFLIFEDGFNSYGDALWYCFAVVTTIGFGDFTSTSVLCRVLSVILGIYGIIVVAVITSVIVNFYNEIKHEKDDDDTDKIEEKKE